MSLYSSSSSSSFLWDLEQTDTNDPFKKYIMVDDTEYFKSIQKNNDNNDNDCTYLGFNKYPIVEAVAISNNKSVSAKKKKETISKSHKELVWNKFIGEEFLKYKCLCCKTRHIKINDFHCGHILAEANGGTQELNNLRPICRQCNQGMGTMHMLDYIKKCGYYY